MITRKDYDVTTDGTMILLERMNERQLEQWHERAAIMEHMGSLSRADAEHMAALDVLRDILPQRKGKGS